MMKTTRETACALCGATWTGLLPYAGECIDLQGCNARVSRDMTLARIDRYVDAHGFDHRRVGYAVRIYIPTTKDGKGCEDTIIDVRTFHETREALGY